MKIEKIEFWSYLLLSHFDFIRCRYLTNIDISLAHFRAKTGSWASWLIHLSTFILHAFTKALKVLSFIIHLHDHHCIAVAHALQQTIIMEISPPFPYTTTLQVNTKLQKYWSVHTYAGCIISILKCINMVLSTYHKITQYGYNITIIRHHECMDWHFRNGPLPLNGEKIKKEVVV